MALLLVVGIMNIAWMVALTAVFVLEKQFWRYSSRVSVAVGVVLCALGVAILVHPSLIDSMTSIHHGTVMGG